MAKIENLLPGELFKYKAQGMPSAHPYILYLRDEKNRKAYAIMGSTRPPNSPGREFIQLGPAECTGLPQITFFKEPEKNTSTKVVTSDDTTAAFPFEENVEKIPNCRVTGKTFKRLIRKVLKLPDQQTRP